MEEKRTVIFQVFFALIVLFFILSLIFGILLRGEQQFVYYAQSLLEGKLYLLEKPLTWFDCVKFEGKYYWPLGPFPAISLIPFVLLGDLLGMTLYQGYLQPFLVGLIFFFCYKFARKYKFSKNNSLVLAFGFVFASVFQLAALIPWSWYFSHVIAVLFSFFALYEYFFGKKRLLLVGLFVGFVFMTRFTAGLISLFFLLDLFFKDKSFKYRLKDISRFILPLILCGIFLLFLNWSRFGNPLDNGYRGVNAFLLSDLERYELVNYGLFKLRNIPTNFYYYFLKGLDPVRQTIITYGGRRTHILDFPYISLEYPGTSFFVVSPMFLWVFLLLRKDIKLTSEIKYLFVSIFITLFFLLMYFWSGWRQVGPRYTIDFLPSLYLVLLLVLRQIKKIPNIFYLVLIVSSILDLYLLLVAFSI